MRHSGLEDVLKQAGSAWPCCRVHAVSIRGLAARERRFFASCMPWAVAAIAVCHHVTTMDEWTWYQPAGGAELCDADDHALEVCIDLMEQLEECGFASQTVDYPGESGLQFRFVAQATGLGRIGRNAFLLHPRWGPWVHLRVLGATGPFEEHASLELGRICSECDACVEACPAGAISEDRFEGLQCRAYRQARGEYTPVGEAQVYHWCKVCVQVCPIGDQEVRKPVISHR